MTHGLNGQSEQYEDRSFYGWNKRDFLLSVLAISFVVSLIACLSLTRKFFTWGTETDYLATHIPEAKRFLSRKPLELEFHPPLYVITIAFMKVIFKDWLTAGLFVSWFSSMVVLIGNFILFYNFAGRFAAWGNFFALSSSMVFLGHSSQATSDIFFLALYSMCLLLVFFAIKTERGGLWILAGIFLGLSLLTRANGIILLFLLFCPLVMATTLQSRLKNIGWFSLGIISIIFIWVIIAKITGSPLFQKGNHINLAITYFVAGKDRYSYDAHVQVLGKFNNIWDVLTYDPIHIVKIYIKDFFDITNRIISSEMMAFPVYLFALPGTIMLFLSIRNPFSTILLFITILQMFFLNLKMFEDRYYLFLIPVFGAGVGIFFRYLWDIINKIWLRLTVFSILFLLLTASTVGSLKETYAYLHASDKELNEAIPQIKRWIPQGTGIVSRGIYIPYYSQQEWLFFPPADNLEVLRYSIDKWNKNGPIFIYYGFIEKEMRPQLQDLINTEKTPSWLTPIFRSKTPGEWVLYRYDPSPSNCTKK